MEHLGLWVTRDAVKPIDKKMQAKKYEATKLSKRSTSVYRYSELLLRYVGKTLTYVRAFNQIMSSKVKFKWTKIEQDYFK